MRRNTILVGALALGLTALATPASLAAAAPTLEPTKAVGVNVLISKAVGGGSADGTSILPSTDRTGRYVAFMSDAQDLVPGPQGPAGVDQIYVRDRRTGITVRASQSPDGAPGNSPSEQPTISQNGRYLVFSSAATNLAGGDADDADIFRVELATMTTTLVTHTFDGEPMAYGGYYPSVSDDGRFITYESWSRNIVRGDRNRTNDVFLFDVSTGETTAVSHSYSGRETSEDYSSGGAISADGRTVAFDSGSSDIVEGHDGNRDIVAYDVMTRVNRLVTHGNNSSYTEGISADGTHAVFFSHATDLVDGVSDGPHGYLATIATGEIQLVDQSTDGIPANRATVGISVSGDGSLVAFGSYATNLVAEDPNDGADTYLRDVVSGTTTLLSHERKGSRAANGWSYAPSISGDGSYVTFHSKATNIVYGDTDRSESIIGQRLS